MSIPNTQVRASHAVTISVGGVVVGLIQSWAPNQARPTTAVYTLESARAGEIFERVPMNITGTTINVNRVDLYGKRMEQAWGPGFTMVMLTDKRNPLAIKETWQNPDGSFHVGSYEGCWFTSMGRNLPADGDKVVRVNASIDYTTYTELL